MEGNDALRFGFSTSSKSYRHRMKLKSHFGDFFFSSIIILESGFCQNDSIKKKKYYHLNLDILKNSNILPQIALPGEFFWMILYLRIRGYFPADSGQKSAGNSQYRRILLNKLNFNTKTYLFRQTPLVKQPNPPKNLLAD